MNLRQLRAFCEVAAYDLKISTAARAMHTSQPSISRYLSSLEEELGVALFRRTEKRILGTTEAGQEVLRAATRLLREAENISRIGRDFADESKGELTIGASHTTARYFLPSIINAFVARYPRVQLVIRQADPTHVAHLVSTGDVDLSVSPRGADEIADLVFIPCHTHGRVVLVPAKHPLLNLGKPSLKQVAAFPLITYSREFPAYSQIMSCFRKGNVTPNIVLTASDIDVMKTYVECGLGVAIVASTAFDALKDKALRAVDINHLIPATPVNICLRRGTRLRSYTFDFIRMVSPPATREVVEGYLGAG